MCYDNFIWRYSQNTNSVLLDIENLRLLMECNNTPRNGVIHKLTKNIIHVASTSWMSIFEYGDFTCQYRFGHAQNRGALYCRIDCHPIRSAKVQINRNVCCRRQSPFNSLKPSEAYMCQYYIQTLVQIIARRLFCAQPLSEPMQKYCQLDYKEYISVKCFFIHIQRFHWR